MDSSMCSVLNTAIPAHRVAVHEAGHAVAATSFGVRPEPRIWTQQHGPYTYWHGECRYHDRDYPPYSHERTVMGMAGPLAELLSIRPTCTTPTACAWLQMKTLSEADSESMAGYTEEHVRACLSALREGWPVVQSIAQRLLVSPSAGPPDSP